MPTTQAVQHKQHHKLQHECLHGQHVIAADRGNSVGLGTGPMATNICQQCTQLACKQHGQQLTAPTCTSRGRGLRLEMQAPPTHSLTRSSNALQVQDAAAG
jgi:hypothetical protein